MSCKNRYVIQSALLLWGVVFSWTNVFRSFSRFRLSEGAYLKFADCTLTNPLLTPCAWGAFAFFIAFIWSVLVIRIEDNKKKLIQQKRLMILLLGGTLFAFSVVGFETLEFFHSKTGTFETCTGVVSSPLESACFLGALTYLVSYLFARNMIVMQKNS